MQQTSPYQCCSFYHTTPLQFFFLLQWFIDEIDKMRHVFLRKGFREAPGGVYVINRIQACKPKNKEALASMISIYLVSPCSLNSGDNYNMMHYHENPTLLQLLSISKAGPFLNVPLYCSPFQREVLKCSKYFNLGFHFRFHNTSNLVCFWIDLWMGTQPLPITYPSLFNTVVDLKATIALQISNGIQFPTFRSLLSPQRLFTLITLLQLLSPLPIYASNDSLTGHYPKM